MSTATKFRRAATPTFGVPSPTIIYTSPFCVSAGSHPRRGPAGLELFDDVLDLSQDGGDTHIERHVAAWRTPNGYLAGVLHLYPHGQRHRHPDARKAPGEYHISVDPEYQGRGIGLALLRAADEEWGIDFWRQSYTIAGYNLVLKYLQEGR